MKYSGLIEFKYMGFFASEEFFARHQMPESFVQIRSWQDATHTGMETSNPNL